MSKIDHVIMFIASIASAIVIGCLLGSIIVCCLTSCTTTKYVTVPETHTEIYYRTDTLRQTDSIIDKQVTVVREVDSATMAQYGIRLESMQRAWLIESDRWQKEIERLSQTRTDTVCIIDSVPVPYPKPEYIEKKLTPWQKFRIWIGDFVVIAAILLIIFAVWKAIRIT